MAEVLVGVDVGGTKCLAVAVVEQGGGPEVVGRHQAATPSTGAELIDAVANVATTAAEAAGASIAQLGVGLPGLVDRAGTLRFAPNLPGIVDLAVADPLAERLGVTVRCDNDATCAAWGERHLGAAKGHDDMVLVTLGTGIGGGVVAGGQLQSGAHGFAGEVGHMVVAPDGPLCPCGRRGCWERFASGSGLGRMAREAAQAGAIPGVVERAGGEPEAVRGEHVTIAALEGDADAVGVLAELGRWLAVGLANLVAILDPTVVVVGGGLVAAGDVLLDPARRHLAEMLIGGEHRPELPIVAATLGADAGAVGAALLKPHG